MCGRFYIDDDTAREIEKTIRKADEKLRRELRGAHNTSTDCIPGGAVHVTSADRIPRGAAHVTSMDCIPGRTPATAVVQNAEGTGSVHNAERAIVVHREITVCPVGDVRPADVATVITAAQSKLATAAQSTLTTAAQRWGFPGFGDRKLIINARAESVLEKNMFRESVLKRRILVPAAGFYEWNRKKEKAIFTAQSKPILYLAGFYSHFEGEDRFVILTTEANASMRDVHDRMPLMFEGEEIEAWLRDDRRLEDMLHKVPQQLHKNMEYEQQTLNLMF